MSEFRDLLNKPLPAEWKTMRHCPSCGGVDLKVSSGEIEVGDWCFTSCAHCGRHLRTDRIDHNGVSAWEDPEWVKASEQ